MIRPSLYFKLIKVFILSMAIGNALPLANAQVTPRAKNTLEVEIAGTVGANGSLEGTVVDRQLYIVGLSYRRLLIQRENVAIRYTFEAIPLAALREPFFVTGCNFPGPNRCVAVQAPQDVPFFTHRRTSYGAGASPAGIEFDFRPAKRVQPFVGVRGGFIYFNRNVLETFASQLNFILDGRVGARLPLRSGKDISFAYMFQHLSNADIGSSNPGLDSHMISLSYSFRWPFGHKQH